MCLEKERHHVFVAGRCEAIPIASQALKAVFTLGLAQMLDLPMNNRRLHPLQRKKRQDVGIGAFGVNLQKIKPLGRQAFEDIIKRNAIDGFLSDHSLQSWNEISVFDDRLAVEGCQSAGPCGARLRLHREECAATELPIQRSLKNDYALIAAVEFTQLASRPGLRLDQNPSPAILVDVFSQGVPGNPIEHTDLDRSIKLQIGVDDEVPLSEAIARIEAEAERIRPLLPLGYSLELAGQASDLARTWNAFQGALLLALVVTYLLLASLFESFRLPAVLLVSVPFAASGGLVALKLLQLFDPTVKLDTITMLGFVILIGVVVNNGILLVHQTLNRLSEGRNIPDAILEAVSTRVRPIFMTMTTTVFGMSPLVLAGGSGSELYRGLAAILMGGLLVSTLFTLILVPALVSLVLRTPQPAEDAKVQAWAGS